MVARLLTTSYPDMSFVKAMGVEVPPPLLEVMRRKDRGLATRSAHLVSDDLLDAFTWAGTAEQVAERAHALVNLGITDFTVTLHPPPNAPIEPAIRSFAHAMNNH